MLSHDGVVEEVPMFRSWVHPGVLMDLLVFEVCVSNDQLVFCADGYQQIPIGICVLHSKLIKNIQPGMMGLANSRIKVSKKDNFICIQDSTKYLIKLVIETANFFRAVGQNWDTSSNQSRIPAVDQWKLQCDKSVTYWFGIFKHI